MANFSIRRLRDAQQEKFRWTPQQTTGTALLLKESDYQDDGEVDADSPYEAWLLLRKQQRELRVGDVLVTEGSGTTHICRYSGFEEAQWFVPNLDLQHPLAEQVHSHKDSPQ